MEKQIVITSIRPEWINADTHDTLEYLFNGHDIQFTVRLSHRKELNGSLRWPIKDIIMSDIEKEIEETLKALK